MRKKIKIIFYVMFSFMTIVILCVTFFLKPFTAYTQKNVLIWIAREAELLDPMGNDSEIFVRRNCLVRNCHVTWDRNFLGNISSFDAILFHGPQIIDIRPKYYFPKERSAHQSYIFASRESSDNYKAPDTRFNGVFNFTWTYKLNSDISLRYMVIRDREGKIIGPNATIEWININDMLPINDNIKKKLASKRIAAAWFVSRCHSNSIRRRLSKEMVTELDKYNMNIDVYGACGPKQCDPQYMHNCLQKLQRDYYFYLAFENSISDDYVTEKLLNSLQNYVVPIVYGGADYRRFMPDGIYLNAGKMSVEELVQKMAEAIENKQKYYDFFKWHNHYSYHHPEETAETDPYCALCSFINNINQSKASTIKNFYQWWNFKTKIFF